MSRARPGPAARIIAALDAAIDGLASDIARRAAELTPRNPGTLRHQPPHFRCPACGAVSFHPQDIEHGYCGRCHAFTGVQPGSTPGPVS